MGEAMAQYENNIHAQIVIVMNEWNNLKTIRQLSKLKSLFSKFCFVTIFHLGPNCGSRTKVSSGEVTSAQLSEYSSEAQKKKIFILEIAKI